jgi:hypothetical protein
LWQGEKQYVKHRAENSFVSLVVKRRLTILTTSENDVQESDKSESTQGRGEDR